MPCRKLITRPAVLWVWLIVFATAVNTPSYAHSQDQTGYCAAMDLSRKLEHKPWQNEFLGAVEDYRNAWSAHNYPRALKEIRKAESLAKGRPVSVIGQGELFIDFGSINYVLGELAIAEHFLMKGVSILLEHCSPNSPMIGKGLNSLANVYLASGRHEQAIDFLNKAMVSFEHQPDEAVILNNLAQAYLSAERFGDAENTLDQAEIKADRLAENKSDLHMQIRMNRAALFFVTGRFHDALDALHGLVEEWRDAAGAGHIFVAHALNNRGEINRVLGLLDDARDDFSNGLKIARSSGFSAPLIHLTLLDNAFKLEIDANNLSAAQMLIDEASNLITEHGLEGTPSDVTTRQLSAHLMLASGQPEKAKSEFEAVLSERRKMFGDFSPVVAETLHSLTMVATQIALQSAQGGPVDFSDVFALSSEAVLLVEQMTGPGAAAMSAQTEFSELKRVFRPIFEWHLQLLWDLALLGEIDTVEANARSFEIAQIMKRLGAAAVAADLDLRNSQELPPPMRQAIEAFQRLALERTRLLSEIDRLAALPVSAERNGGLEKLRARLADVIRRLDAVRGRVNDDDLREMFAERVVLTPQVIASRLAADEAIVTYLSLEGRSFGWLVNPSGELYRFEISAGADKLNSLIRGVRSSMDREKFEGAEFDANSAHKLYQLLIAPIADRLSATKHLYIVGDGPVTALPFSVLIEREAGSVIGFDELSEIQWLVKRFAMTTLPAVFSINPVDRSDRGTKRPLLALTAPDPFPAEQESGDLTIRKEHWRRANRVFASLTAERDKIEDRLLPLIADPGRDVIGGRNLTEARLKQLSDAGALNSYAVLSFYTHGFMTGDMTGLNEPGLVLTAATNQNDKEDGFLFASEIERLRLDAEWVILGACNTARRGQSSPDSLDTLARAFFRAGARSLMITHWKTRSDIAIDVVAILSALPAGASGRSAAERLREIQLRFLSDYEDPTKSHPYLWAPFSVVGSGSE